MKKTLFLILGSIFTLTLSSCGGTNPSESSAKPQKVYITWKDYDGTPLLNDIYDYGEMPSYKGVTPTRAKDAQFTYTFSGWSPEIVPATKDESYVAQYSTVTNRYSITWTNYDGTILSNETYEYGEMPDYKGKTPTRTKDAQYTYSFSGWSPSISKVTGDATYKANYSKELNKYVVSWRNFDGSLLFDETYEYGAIPSFKEELPFKPRDEQYTYSFSGWSPSITKVVCDTSYTAQFSETINTYEITWANYNGDILSVETYEYGQLPSYKGDTPTRPKDDHYYFFDGWTDTIVSVTCNKTYTAKYAYGYLITWQNYNGDVLETDIVKEGDTPVYAGSIPEKPIDDTHYYTFSKWSPEIIAASSDTTYTATFDSNDILTFVAKSSSYSLSKCNYTKIENIVIPSTYRGFPVDEIGKNAFKDCNKLKNFVVPDSITTIGAGAFEGCDSLESMTLPFVGLNKNATVSSSSTLFGSIFGSSNSSSEDTTTQYSASSTVYYKIPKSLRTIRVTGGNLFYGAFSGCSSLTSITIPEGVTSINGSVFSGCSSLNSITIPEGVTSIGNFAFKGCSSLTSITIPEGVTSINGSVFSGCSSLTSITIPDGVTSIGEYAFSGCSSLTSITIHKGVTSIGNYAFSGCSSLTSITIPEGVTSIGKYAFEECLSLKDVVIGKGAIKYGSYIFNKCESLRSITLPFSSNEDDQTYMCQLFNQYSDSSKFTQIHGYYRDYSINYYVPKSLDTIIVNDGLILDYAFYGLSVIKTISIESNVTSIGKKAFYNCSSLINLNLPNTVISIGQDAFAGCSNLPGLSLNNSTYKTIDGVIYNSNLTKLICCLPGKTDPVNIPSSVTTIGEYAFSGCSKLVSIVIPDSVTTIGAYAFSGCSSLQSITLPFVGQNKNATQYSKYFGSIFGDKDYDGSTSVRHWDGNSHSSKYYIPSSLRTVIIMGGKILSGALSGCSMLRHVTLSDDVETIEHYAFEGCNNLKNFVVPDSIITIGACAFEGCYSLESMTLPFVGQNKNATEASSSTLFGSIFSEADPSYEYATKPTKQYYSSSQSVYYLIPESLRTIRVTGGNLFYGAFSGCSSLTSITISDGVSSIDGYTFYGCSSLTSITIPDGVTSIGNCAFSGCSSLTSITIPEGVTSIDYYAFYGCSSLTSITILEGVTSIGYYAFCGCSSLTSITIPEGVTSINSGAFSGCSSLTSITIPESVTSIGGYAFSGCSSVTSITIPESVTSIGEYAFSNCTSLTSAEISCDMTFNSNIHSNIFSGCDSLETIKFGNNVSSIDISIFTAHASSLRKIEVESGNRHFKVINNALYNYELTKLIYVFDKDIESFAFIDGVTSIGEYAFSGCSSVTSITIPNSVTSIGYGTFWGCSSLTSVTIPDGVTSIGEHAFRGCSSLASITIPNSVTSIEYGTFWGCSSLTSITIPDSVSSIGNYAFSGCSSLATIIIPNSVTSVGLSTFYNCPSLRIVFYCGTPSEWLAIGSNISLDKVYFYSETVPTEAGNYWRYVDGVPQIWEVSVN